VVCPVAAKIGPIAGKEDRKARFHGLKTPNTMPLPQSNRNSDAFCKRLFFYSYLLFSLDFAPRVHICLNYRTNLAEIFLDIEDFLYPCRENYIVKTTQQAIPLFRWNREHRVQG
jgi:hypothetical protein